MRGVKLVRELDGATGNEAATELELKSAKVRAFKRAEVDALRWVARGGARSELVPPPGGGKSDNKSNNLQPADLASRWRLPKHAERLTAKAFYQAVERETRKEVVDHFRETGDRKAAAKVVDAGTPELVEAMDKGEVSISAAAELAKLPEDEQRPAKRLNRKQFNDFLTKVCEI